MKLWNVILATLVIFGAGVLTGALAVNISNRREQVVQAPIPAPPSPVIAETTPPPKQVQPTAKPPRMPVNKEFLARLNERLNLNTNQFSHIELILKESSERTRKMAKDEAKLVKEKIEAELTDDQRKKFDEGNIKVPIKQEKANRPNKGPNSKMDPNKNPGTD